MDRKVYVEVKVRLVIRMDEGVAVEDVIADCDYNFISQTDGADIESTEIRLLGHSGPRSKGKRAKGD